MKHASAIVMAFVLTTLMTGCGVKDVLPGPPAALQIVSRDKLESADGPPFKLNSDFDEAIYRYENDNTLTVLLFQGPQADPWRIAAVTMFWQPRAGATPTEDSSTNAVIRFIEFRTNEGGDEKLGVYAGAGFMRVNSDPGTGTLNATLAEADLRLTDRSEGFEDRLGRSVLAGAFKARRDDTRVGNVLRSLNLRVTDGLGYPRLVRSTPEPDAETQRRSML